MEKQKLTLDACLKHIRASEGERCSSCPYYDKGRCNIHKKFN